jgi:dienelactone hydrolase
MPSIPVRRLKPCYSAIPLLLFLAGAAIAQSDPEQVGAILGEEILPPSVAVFQVRQYLLGRVAPAPLATTAEQWTGQARRLRQHLLDHVVFHGWPEEWVNAPPKFEDLGVMETGEGYRLRKLRYEIVPGFQSVAILYEPENLQGKVPAILNVNGHVGPRGKAVEYKQKRCINFAKHGMMALDVEWLAFGELGQEENRHWFGAHLDLVGTSALGLFYLEMRRGLDYLYEHPHADRNRLGVTGLSGGGWQTIVLSALDERVKVAVPVAGYSSTRTRIEARRYGDLGDLEQNATDFLAGQDYQHLTAMMAPRPTLLVYNAEDDCCFRGPMAKPWIFDAIRPFFRLYGREDSLEWHENRDPGGHNYQLDNRQAAYRFFSRQFNLPAIESEIPSGQEIKDYDELVVGLPGDNLTILGLARKLAEKINRPPVPTDPVATASWADSERQKLAAVVRYKPAALARVWTVANTKSKGVETKSYLFQMSDGLGATGVWLKGLVTPAKIPVTVVLNDGGKKEAAVEVSDRVNRDEQVLAVDLVFTGDAWDYSEPDSYTQIVAGIGERPLGIEAAQLTEIGRWVGELAGVPKVRLECKGIRSQVVALVASALEPNLFSALVIHEGMPSLGFLLQAPVTFKEAPELFCLDLYNQFDLDRLAALAAPTEVTVRNYVSKKK